MIYLFINFYITLNLIFSTLILCIQNLNDSPCASSKIKCNGNKPSFDINSPIVFTEGGCIRGAQGNVYKNITFFKGY